MTANRVPLITTSSMTWQRIPGTELQVRVDGAGAAQVIEMADPPALPPLTDQQVVEMASIVFKVSRPSEYALHEIRRMWPRLCAIALLSTRDGARYRVLRDGRHLSLPRMQDPLDPHVMFMPEGLDRVCDAAIAAEQATPAREYTMGDWARDLDDPHRGR